MAGRLGRLCVAASRASSLVRASSSVASVPHSLALRSFSLAAAVNPVVDEVYNRQRNVVILENRVPVIAVDAWVAPG
jgi:hypothetical protein